MNILRILFACAALLGSAAPGFANFAMSPSGSTTAFAIDAANQGTSLCAAASTECGAVVTINTAGAPLFTSSAPGLVSISQGGNTALVKAGNSAATTDVAVVVSDPNVLAAVQGPLAIGGNRVGYVTDDPCGRAVKVNFPIGGSGGNIQIVGGSGSTKVYLCSLSLIAAATAVVNVIEGTGAACTTANEAAVIGSTTAASGMSLAANGGLTYGNGTGTVGVTVTAGNGLCILQSGTTALAGNATYVQQ